MQDAIEKSVIFNSLAKIQFLSITEDKLPAVPMR